MSFVGIICNPKQEVYMKRILNSNLDDKNWIILKEDTIDNFKNITFETIAIFSKQVSVFQKKEILSKMIEKAKYVIINADEEIDFEWMKAIQGNVITYGFNSKSTVTASSVNEDSILICLQRTIQNRFGKEIEPQEILIPIPSHKINSSTIMGMISLLFVYGKEHLKFQ